MQHCLPSLARHPSIFLSYTPLQKSKFVQLNSTLFWSSLYATIIFMVFLTIFSPFMQMNLTWALALGFPPSIQSHSPLCIRNTNHWLLLVRRKLPFTHWFFTRDTRKFESTLAVYWNGMGPAGTKNLDSGVSSHDEVPCLWMECSYTIVTILVSLMIQFSVLHVQKVMISLSRHKQKYILLAQSFYVFCIFMQEQNIENGNLWVLVSQLLA